MSQKAFRIGGIFGVTALLVAGATIWLRPEQQTHAVALRAAEPRAGATPIIYQTPAFSCPDQDGNAVDNNSMRGKVWIADFIFTHCGSTCPRMTDKRVELSKVLDDRRIMFLSFSVDPERDDRSTRKAYAAEHGMDATRWRFVSPPNRDAAMQLAAGMKIGSAGHGVQSPILHSDRFLLIDGSGRVRGSYELDDQDAMQRLITDARNLAAPLPVLGAIR